MYTEKMGTTGLVREWTEDDVVMKWLESWDYQSYLLKACVDFQHIEGGLHRKRFRHHLRHGRNARQRPSLGRQDHGSPVLGHDARRRNPLRRQYGRRYDHHSRKPHQSRAGHDSGRSWFGRHPYQLSGVGRQPGPDHGRHFVGRIFRRDSGSQWPQYGDRRRHRYPAGHRQ